MKIPNLAVVLVAIIVSLARIVSEDSQHYTTFPLPAPKSSKDS